MVESSGRFFVLFVLAAVVWLSGGVDLRADEGADASAPAVSGFDLSGLSAGSLFAGPNGGGQEPPKPPEEPKPWGGYDSKLGGFFLQSQDGKFKLNFNARIQARYTYFGKDSQGGDGNDSDESYFELERARIGFSGHLFDPALTFKVEIDAETDAGDKGALTDAFVYYKAHEAFNAGIGQFKPAFIREEFNSSARLQRVERSVMTEFFNIDRNVGLWADGYFAPNKLLYYNVALTNGIDTVNIAPGGGSAQVLDQNPAFVAKMDVTLMGDHKYSYEQADIKLSSDPLLVMGASGVFEKYSPGQVDATTFISTAGEVYSFGVDGVFKWKGVSVTGDYVGRWYDADGAEALYAHGFTVQGGFFILPANHVELTGRLSTVWGNEGPNDGNAVEVGPGVNWYFSGSHNGKLQLDVAWVDISDNLPSSTEEVRLGPNDGFGSSAAGFSEGEQGVLTRFQIQLTF